MPRDTVIQYCALNVAAHPHPEGVYQRIFDAVALRQVRYWGDHFATLSMPTRRGDGYFQGTLVTWTEIDTSEPGVDKRRLAEIDLSNVELNLPENIGFNGRIFLYTFRERDHTIFVETKNEFGKRLSPAQVARILTELFAQLSTEPDMPLVEVTLIPDEDALNRILRLKRLMRLEIHLVRPNADDLDVEEILAELEKQGAKSMEKTLVAMPKSEGLDPDERTTKQAEVAEFNGYVAGKGRDADGNPVKLSTKEHPRVIEQRLGDDGSALGAALAVAQRQGVRRSRRQDV